MAILTKAKNTKCRNNNCFFAIFRTLSGHTSYFFFRYSNIPLKAVRKIIQFRTFKIIWAHSPNTWNESVHILIIRRMNLFVYRERICTYTENTQNEINLRTKFRCSYSDNTRNESVRILRICGMNMFIY
jgi:hypothetical protein